MINGKSTQINSCNDVLNSVAEQNSGLLSTVEQLTQTISWLQNTGTQEVTGQLVELEPVGIELKYPMQPSKPAWDYDSNTAVLNNYAEKTRQTAEFVPGMKWEIIVHLRKKPTIHTVMYFKTNNVYCGGRLNEQINENNDFVLNVDGFKIWKNHCVLRKSNGSLPDKIYIGGYVANFVWNWIETITIR